MVHNFSIHYAAIWGEDLHQKYGDVGSFQKHPTECLLVGVEQTSADRIAFPLLQAPPDLSLVTIVTEAGCPTMHCSSPAPIASLWLATALLKTIGGEGSHDVFLKY